MVCGCPAPFLTSPCDVPPLWLAALLQLPWCFVVAAASLVVTEHNHILPGVMDSPVVADSQVAGHMPGVAWTKCKIK